MTGWTIEFHEAAKSEVADWPFELRAALNRIFDRILAVGLERVREPLVKHIDGKLWEMRASGSDLEGRALYAAVTGKRVVVVLAFIKKTRKTPRKLIALALKRVEQIQ
jgi:phage-related protein